MIRNGEILGGMYQIVREIGQGGTGVIYLAEHLRLRKKIVVKKIKDGFAGRIEGRIEADILKRLHHTYLPQVYDILVVGSGIYTVMEYVEGRDLQVCLDQGQSFSEQTLRKWMLQLSEVLEYLHSQRPPILHCDIKPANIMITNEGNVCLIDFNISIDGSDSKDLKGISQWFAAPEQYEKARILNQGGKADSIKLDPRMDIYSLGASFYRVMTGRLPSPEREVQDILEIEVPYSEGLKAIVSKAMKRRPEERFQTAERMTKALRDSGRMDPLYRWYGKLQIACLGIWLALVIMGALLLYQGKWQYGTEAWQKAYHELYVAAREEDDTQIVSKATQILNMNTYKWYLKKNIEKKAAVLNILGESYFRQELFEEAAGAYGEAWEIVPRNGEYYKNYLIALARGGQIWKARKEIQSGGYFERLTTEEQKLIEAQICWMDEEEKEALSILNELMEGRTELYDKEILLSACLLQAEIYEENEEYGKALSALDTALGMQESKDILRQAGWTAVEAAEREAEERKTEYLKKAKGYYQRLGQKGQADFEDYMNLAITEQALGDYSGSNEVLKNMEFSYPDDYRITMWQCYNYLNIAKKENSYENVIEELRYKYEKCKHDYDITGKTDYDMEELVEIMKKLGE